MSRDHREPSETQNLKGKGGEMRITGKALASLSLATVLVPVATAQPVILGVLNGASSSAAVSPGCRIAIYGANFASASLNAPSGALPNTLGGVSVMIGGLPALVYGIGE